MRYMASYLKSCRPGKAAELRTSESMLPLAGATERVLEKDVMPRRKREKTRSGGMLLPRENLKFKSSEMVSYRNASETANSPSLM